MHDGTIERDGERIVLRYERTLRHPVGTVWHTITDPEELDRWAGMKPELDLRPGGAYVTVHAGVRVVDRVLTVEPPRLFEHTFWNHVNPSAVVTWLLTKAGAGCTLTLTHSLSIDDVDNAAATIAEGMQPVAIIARTGAGWHHLLDLLGSALDGADDTWSLEVEDALVAGYEAIASAAVGR